MTSKAPKQIAAQKRFAESSTILFHLAASRKQLESSFLFLWTKQLCIVNVHSFADDRYILVLGIRWLIAS